MVKRPSRSQTPVRGSSDGHRGNVGISHLASRARETGRSIMLVAANAPREAARALTRRAGLTVQTAKESGGAAPTPGHAKLMPRLGVAIVNADPDQLRALHHALGVDPLLQSAVEPEYMLYSAADTSWIRGYRDAVDHIAAYMLEGRGQARLAGSQEATWGVLATGAAQSTWTGKGTRIAVLDTGIDLAHPDFAARPPAGLASFIDGETVDDGNGHGTHCAGVAVGGGAPHGTATRYGVAGEAELFVAKVLSNLGEGPEQSILHGIEWAIENRCNVASMSLSAQAPRSDIFEQVGQRALEAGTLLVAAAGNDSNRPSRLMPVGYPANCDSIIAVAALDRQLMVARFSNVGGSGGDRIDIAAPGVGVMSSWTGARTYLQESGTSMATPFVAGIAALLAQAHPKADAAQLARMLRDTARKLPGAQARDVGAGLVQAPA